MRRVMQILPRRGTFRVTLWGGPTSPTGAHEYGVTKPKIPLGIQVRLVYITNTGDVRRGIDEEVWVVVLVRNFV